MNFLHTRMTDGRPITINMDMIENFHSSSHPSLRDDLTVIVMMSCSSSEQPRTHEVDMPYREVLAWLDENRE